MSAPTVADLTNGCFSGQVLTEQEQRALMVYFMAQQLKAVGGTDYTAALTTTLVTDVDCLATLNSAQRKEARLVVEFTNANLAGASLSSSINVLKAAIACLVNVPGNTLDVMEISLRSQLKEAAAQ